MASDDVWSRRNHAPAMVRMEIEGMGMAIQKALSERHDAMRVMIDEAIDDFIGSGKLDQAIRDAVKEEVPSVVSRLVKEAVYGGIDRTVRAQIAEALKGEE